MVKKSSIFILTAFLIVYQLAFSQEIIWENIVEVDFRSVCDISVDEEDNIYVCFSNIQDYTLGSYDKDGILRWGFSDTSMAYNGVFYGDEEGNSYMIGSIENAQGHADCIYKIFDSEGMPVNQSIYSSSNFSDELGTWIKLDDEKNIYINGFSKDGNDYSLFTLKANPSGMILWAQHEDLKAYSIPQDLIIDDAGNIYSMVFTAKHSDTMYSTLVKYDPDGQLLFAREMNLDGYPGLILGNLHFDSQGDIVTAGIAHTLYSDDGCVIKMDIDGNVIWSRTFNASSGYMGIFDIDLDDNDNIYLGGRITNTDDDAYYAKLRPDGELDWEKVYDGPGVALDHFIKVILRNNYCYFIGVETGISSQWDFLVLKTNQAGDIIWKLTYDGPAHKTDDLEDFCFDTEDNILMCGFTEVGVFDSRGITIKYSNPLGIDEITGPDVLLSVYPNPAVNYIEIQSWHLSPPAVYYIIDIHGRSLQQGEINDFSNFHIDLQGLGQGIYFLVIDDGHKQYNAKFVKN
jgi:hypothetical protein